MYLVQQDLQDYLDLQDPRVLQEYQVMLELMGCKDLSDLQDLQDCQEWLEQLGHLVVWADQVHLEIQVHKDHQEYQEELVQLEFQATLDRKAHLVLRELQVVLVFLGISERLDFQAIQVQEEELAWQAFLDFLAPACLVPLELLV